MLKPQPAGEFPEDGLVDSLLAELKWDEGELVRLLAAATLHAQGWQNKEIARKLRIAEATVGRRLQIARNYQVLREVVLEDRGLDRFKPNVKALIYQLGSQQGPSLMDKLQQFQEQEGFEPTLHSVQIVSTQGATTLEHNPPSENEEKLWSRRLDAFAKNVGPSIAEVLRPAKTIGVSWGGSTLASVVRSISRQPRWRSRRGETVCLPTTGKRESDQQPNASSSRLARELAESVLSGEAISYSLSEVPAFFAMEFGHKELPTLKKWINRNTSYRKIFGKVKNDEPLIEKLDAIITSCGAIGNAKHFWAAELTGGLGVESDVLQELCCADIGGVLLPRTDSGTCGRQQLHDITQRWTGITLEFLQDLARRATKETKPGIVLLAVGGNKAEAVYQCVKCGVVNQLFLDGNLAEELWNLLP